MKPFDPRLLRAAGQTKAFLAATVAIALIATAGTLVVAYSLTQFVVEVFVDKSEPAESSSWLLLAIAAAGVRAVAHYLGELFGYRTAKGIKGQFRNQALAHFEQSQVSNAGAMSQLLGPGLDALDGYFGKFLPQLVFTVLVTPIFIVVIFLNDPISAASILLTLPLIPIFMVLIGLVTKDVQTEQLNATTTLSSHFLQVLRGITTLKIFGRIERQLVTLDKVSQEQKRRTMKVLRLSFLSGFALELAASLSVALIAVQIGLRLVDGAMTLSVGLFVLLLAPEVYLPIRNVGVQFHNSQAGVAATEQLLDILEQSPAESSSAFEIEPGITVIEGVSGSGKSTLIRGLVNESSAWMPQQVSLLNGTIAQNVAGFDDLEPDLLKQVLADVGLGGLSVNLMVNGTNGLSGGQAQRILLARALYRLRSRSLKVLLLDEPSSMLDSTNQLLIANLIQSIAASGVRVVIATHQDSMRAIADRVILLKEHHAQPS